MLCYESEDLILLKCEYCSNLKIQYNPYQNPNDIFYNRKTHPKIHMDSQGTPNNRNNLENEKDKVDVQKHWERLE